MGQPTSSASTFPGEAAMIAANYFDGRSARLHPVQLLARDGTVAVSGGDIAKLYPAAAVTLAEPFAQAPAVLYFNDGARCEVAGEARAALAAALGYRPSRVVRWQKRWPAALAALVLLVALIFATAVWGVPAAAERVAAALPPSVDRALGTSTLAALESHSLVEPSRLSDERIEQVQQVWRKVLPARPRMPVRLLVRHAPAIGANAFALPDGTIIITDRMVLEILGKQTEFGNIETAQLAGVLAHEIGHVEGRHSARALARSSLTAALSAALFGDFSAVAAGAPAVLMNMSNSREMETEADSYAIAALKARGMPLAPLADLFESLGELDDAADHDAPEWLAGAGRYVASHPAPAERGARLRAAAP
jgi:predicted Zn-dependent protease